MLYDKGSSGRKSGRETSGWMESDTGLKQKEVGIGSF